jgi:flagellar motor switch protein FliG
MSSNDEGLDKSALLLMTLGADEAAEVLKQLGPKEVQKLGAAMAAMPAQSREKLEEILDEVLLFAEKGTPIEADHDHIKAMLTKALGDERANHLIGRVLQGSDTAGIESLKWMDAPTAADLIKNEHPQIIATILVHLEFDQAGEILKHFTDRLRNDVLLRIATLDGVQPVALRELNEALTRMLSGATTVKKTAMGGVRHAADILNFVGSAAETAILDNVREYDPDLAQKILDEMFVFENLMDLDDRGIQTLLREVQSDSLVIALKGAPPRCARRSSRTCPSAPPKCSGKTSNPAARCASPRSRPSRRRSSRPPAAWPKKARSPCPARRRRCLRVSAQRGAPPPGRRRLPALEPALLRRTRRRAAPPEPAAEPEPPSPRAPSPEPRARFPPPLPDTAGHPPAHRRRHRAHPRGSPQGRLRRRLRGRHRPRPHGGDASTAWSRAWKTPSPASTRRWPTRSSPCPSRSPARWCATPLPPTPNPSPS